MEIFNGIIEGTNTHETQEILKQLDSEKDILLTSVDAEEKKIEVQFIQPINQIKSLGFVPQEIADAIFEKYGDGSNVDIADYIVTFENGVYGLVADIEVEELPEENEEPKSKRLPLPLLVVVGTLTGILTAVLVVLKMIKSFRKK